MNNCNSCKNTIPEASKAVCCDSCHIVMHPLEACTGLNASELRAVVIQKRTMLYFCKTCREAFKNVPALLHQIGELKNELELLKKELETVKKHKCNHGDSEISTEEIVNEIQERANRSRNFIIYNVKESGSDVLSERIEDDKKVVLEVFETLNITSSSGDKNKVEKVLRIGRKSVGSCRPIKVICADPSCVKEVLKAKKKLVHSDYKINSDQTRIQREQYKKALAELQLKNEGNDKSFVIRYINGSPKVIKNDRQAVRKN